MKLTNKAIMILGMWLLCLAAPGNAQQSIPAFESFWSADRGLNAREEQLYRKGTKALDERQWATAVDIFGSIADLKGDRSDAALYWKAYAQKKLGQYAEALATIESLRKVNAGSRWLNDAKTLNLEMQQASGQAVAPESETDEDLKLLALNSLQNTDPERAIPMIQKLLTGDNSPKLKERALFVLVQSGSPKAKDLLVQIARGSANPDLQMRALHYLGSVNGNANRHLLADIYASSADMGIKRQIIQSFMASGDKDQLLTAAKMEKNLELRMTAVQFLGVLHADASLVELYQREASAQIKESILQALRVAGSSDRLSDLVQREKDSALRVSAIRILGRMRSQKTIEALLSIYEGDKDASVRRQAVLSLYTQKASTALIALARKETDPIMKKAIVSKLSTMDSKEANDYLMEVLSK